MIALRSAIIYFVVVLGMRLAGRRQLGQMTPFDLVLILLIANAVQNAMVGPDATILGGITAAATLIILNEITEFASDRIRFLREAFEGDPILLVHEGKFIEKNLARANVTRELIRQAIREHGFERAEDVHLAVL